MTVKDLAKECNCSRAWIYYIAKQLGRLPTIEEVKSRQGKPGRPVKWKSEE